MAGPMDALLQTFLGQTQQMNQMQAPSQEGSPWQQELLETVNPEKVKRQNIMRSLARASQALATTPGNFLQGVSAAASTGANSYLDGKDEAQINRVKVMQAIDQAQRADQDKRLARLQDALGIARGITNDQYGRQRDAVVDQRYGEERSYSREQDALNREDRKAARASNANLTQNQLLTTKRAIRSELKTLESDLRKPNEIGDTLPPEAIQEQLDQRRMELEDYYGISLDDAPASASPKVVKPDKSSVLTAPPPVESRVQGQVYNTPKGPMTWTGQGWTPAQ